MQRRELRHDARFPDAATEPFVWNPMPFGHSQPSSADADDASELAPEP